MHMLLMVGYILLILGIAKCVIHTYNLSTHGAEVVCHNFEAIWAIELIPGYIRLYSETPSNPQKKFLCLVTRGQPYQWNESMKMCVKG